MRKLILWNFTCHSWIWQEIIKLVYATTWQRLRFIVSSMKSKSNCFMSDIRLYQTPSFTKYSVFHTSRIFFSRLMYRTDHQRTHFGLLSFVNQKPRRMTYGRVLFVIGMDQMHQAGVQLVQLTSSVDHVTRAVFGRRVHSVKVGQVENGAGGFQSTCFLSVMSSLRDVY